MIEQHTHKYFKRNTWNNLHTLINPYKQIIHNWSFPKYVQNN